MAEFRSVGRVQVSLWGRKVGVLVPSPERGYYAFKFDCLFLDSGIQIAPLMMPLAAAPYQFVDLPRNAYEGLPPCFADSLPDGFGNSLIRRWARDRKYDIDELPALDKLCYVGNRAMGAPTNGCWRRWMRWSSATRRWKRRSAASASTCT